MLVDNTDAVLSHFGGNKRRAIEAHTKFVRAAAGEKRTGVPAGAVPPKCHSSEAYDQLGTGRLSRQDWICCHSEHLLTDFLAPDYLPPSPITTKPAQ